jgi:hypothetical protein
MGMRMGIRLCSRVVPGETFSELKRLGVGASDGRGARDGDAVFREFDRSADKREALIIIAGEEQSIVLNGMHSLGWVWSFIVSLLIV